MTLDKNRIKVYDSFKKQTIPLNSNFKLFLMQYKIEINSISFLNEFKKRKQ